MVPDIFIVWLHYIKCFKNRLKTASKRFQNYYYYNYVKTVNSFKLKTLSKTFSHRYKERITETAKCIAASLKHPCRLRKDKTEKNDDKKDTAYEIWLISLFVWEN